MCDTFTSMYTETHQAHVTDVCLKIADVPQRGVKALRHRERCLPAPWRVDSSCCVINFILSALLIFDKSAVEETMDEGAAGTDTCTCVEGVSADSAARACCPCCCSDFIRCTRLEDIS